jgi:hypothetical protein
MLLLTLTSCTTKLVPISLDRAVGLKSNELVNIHLIAGGAVTVREFWISPDSLGGVSIQASFDDASRLLANTNQPVTFGLDQIKEVRYRQVKVRPVVIISLGVTAAVIIGAATRNVKHVYRRDGHR